MFTTRDSYSNGVAGLAAGTGGTFNNTATTYCINGRAYAKAAVTNTNAFTAGHTNLANNQQCVFFIGLNAAGAFVTYQSAIFPSATGSGYLPRAVDWPNPDGVAIVGAIVISCNGSQTFTVGTTVPGTANTATFINVMLDYGTPVAI